ncbi:MAG: CRTAC1 family protein [Rhizobacter sp.]
MSWGCLSRRAGSCVAALLLASCGPKSNDAPAAPAGTTTAAATPATAATPAQTRAEQAPLFREAAEASGLAFRHVNGMSGEFYYAEIIGSGVAVLDYDNDGRMDLLVLQGGSLHAEAPPPSSKPACGARLYHNELVVDADGRRHAKFADVTEKSGLCSVGYGMGVAVGDIDNDGCVDVFVSHFGAPNQLFRNNCNGTFTDVTRKAGVGGAGNWGTSATFFDFDRDGLLDLYVVNYVQFSIATAKKCFASSSIRDYCAPSAYKSVPGILYRNRGDGTFEDVSVKSGITKVFGAGLGVMAVDVDGDGWQDLYVANDGNPNQLWINQKDGTFKDEAPLRGNAVNADGAAEAGMGIDIGDVDNNGTEDIFLTHLTREKSTLFVNRGEGYFEDRSVEAGVAVPSMPFTGFGTALLDYDNDGWLDIVAANGAVRLIEELRVKGDPYPLHQKKQLFHNLGNGRFAEATAAGGPAFELSEVGRGLAAADFDNDGAIDFVVSNNNGPLRLFLNEHRGSDAAWLGLRLMTGKRDAYGAKVEVRRKGAPTLWRRVRPDGSYLSASDPRVLVGLGKAAEIEAVVVHWADGRNERFPTPPLRQYATLVQGSGVGEPAR